MPQKIMKGKRILYLGLDPSRFSYEGVLVHQPLIKTVPKPCVGDVQKKFETLHTYSHVLFTSRTAILFFMEYALKLGFSLAFLKQKIYIAIGKGSAQLLNENQLEPALIAEEETAEGVIQLLETLSIEQTHLFFPRSAQGRDVIPLFLKERGIKHTLLDLYDTVPIKIVLPPLEKFDQIVFTSPSTVHAFFQNLKEDPPAEEKYFCLGPITQKTLNHYRKS